MNASNSDVIKSSFQEDCSEIDHDQIIDQRSLVKSKSLQFSNQPSQQQQQQQCCDDEKISLENTDHNADNSPIWLPRNHQHNQSRESLNSEQMLSKPLSVDDEEADTDLETDRLLGQQRLDDHGFYDDKVISFNIILYPMNNKKIRCFIGLISLVRSSTTFSKITINRDVLENTSTATTTFANVFVSIDSTR